MEIINVTDEIIEVNVTEEVINIQAPTGAYPFPNAVNSVFGRVGNVVGQVGDYTTSLVTEGTNLYYTQARFNTAFGNKTTTDLAEGTNLYFTNARSRASISENITGINYDSASGIFSMASGYVIPTQAMLDAKQDDLNGTGIVKSTAGTITYLTDNTANWDAAYNDKINSAAVTGTTTKTLTLNQQDGGTITASWTDDNTDAVTSVFGRTGAVVATEGDYTLTQLGDVTLTSPASGQVLKYNGTAWINGTDTDTGLTSVGLSMPSAFSVANSPLTANGTLSVTGAGIASQYIRGDGTLADFPTSTGGGSSVSYYLNSSVSQGTIGGVAYRELSKEPIIGAGTDITISANGYVASYITDANDPDVVLVPGGNFNCEFYFSVNSNAHNPYVYAELYKYDGSTFTLLGSSQSVPEYLSNGTTLSPYYFAIPVATAALTITDRLAIRIYVNVDGRVVTLHTENGHLCQVVTTLSKGMVSLNNLTDQSQFLATGTAGTNFAIVSSGDTHTFNLPVASAINTGKLSSTDWSVFNNKQNALTNPVTGTGTTNTLPKFTAASTIGNSNITDSGSLITLGSNTNISLNQNALTTLGLLNTTAGASAGTSIQFGNDVSSIAGGLYLYGSSRLNNNTNQYNCGASFILDYNGSVGLNISSTFTSGVNSGIRFWTAANSGNGIERMRLDSNGALGLGTTSLTGYSLRVSKNIVGATTSYGIMNDGVIQSSVTSNSIYNATTASTAAATFTLGAIIHNYANQGTFGAGSTVNVQVGYYAESTLIGAGTNYGFSGNIPSGTNRWNLFMNGTANNYMAGSLGIGTTSFVSGGGTYNLNLAKSITGTVVAGAMNIGGLVQSDVTSAAIGLNVQVTTAAASFTLNQLRHISVNQTTLGAGSSVSNQYGIYVDQITNGSSNFGFFGNVPAGTNRWNIYMDGTANNYMAGSLGIGSTSLTGFSLVVGKNITGSANSQGIRNNGVIQSDVTGYAVMYNSIASTAAASFTNNTLVHYYAQQGTIGAGSAVTFQYGFLAESNVIGATNNYGFYGAIASGTNRWNLFMAGTAANYMAGQVAIGTTTIGSQFQVNGNAAIGYSASTAAPTNGLLVAGNMGVGTTSPSTYTNLNTITINGTNGSVLDLKTGNVLYGEIYSLANELRVDAVGASSSLGLLTNSVTRLTINPTGSVGIGTTSLTGYTLRTSKNITGATTSYGVTSEGSIQSDVTSSARMFWTLPTIPSGSAVTDVYHYITGQGTFIGTTTNQYGFVASSSLTGGTNNFGFWGNIPSGTNRWNLYMQGTAANYMAGNLGVGATNADVFSRGDSRILGISGSANASVAINATTGSTAFLQLGVNNTRTFQLQSNATETFLGTGTATPLIFTIAFNERARLDVNGNFGVGTNASNNASAKVQIDSTTQGFLPPRMTTTQKLAIGTPAAGLMVYDTTLNQMSYYNGTLWINF